MPTTGLARRLRAALLAALLALGAAFAPSMAAAPARITAPLPTPRPAAWRTPISINGRENGLRLAPRAEVLEDRGGALDLAQVARAPGWRAHPESVFSFGLSHSTWWARVGVRNASADPQAVVFDLDSPNQDFVNWFALRPDGRLALESRSGDRTPFASRLLDKRSLTLPYTLAPHETLQLYLRFASHDGLYEVMSLNLWGARPFARHSDSESLLLNLYHGGLLALALFNLLLFASTRERSLGWYVLYLCAILLNSFCFHGFDFQHFWPQAPDLHNRLIGFSASFGFAAGGLFLLSYLRLKERLSPVVWRLVAALIGLNLAGALIGLLDYYMLAAVCATLFGIALLLLVYGLTVRLLWRGVAEARYAAAAFSFLLLGIIVYYLEGMGALSTNGWGIWAVLTGSALQMLLLAFGLANSMNALKAQALQAERRARAAQQALAGELGQLVEQRTAALETANRRLTELAITDELTAVFNRRHFNHVCAAMLGQERRADPLALCIFDLDNFKGYNDNYGHPAGDDVLRKVAACVREELRRSGDSLFRLGGEEFGILFTAATAPLAWQFIEQLRLALLQLDLPHAANPAGVVSATFGIAWWRPSGAAPTPNQLYAAADQQLYLAKAAGRNRVVLLAL